ncbi:methylmalonyl Co-A mutase-associated GTPase MeaB [Flavobacteriales bacterium]|nr:methylmalonyl Co-A mutase-associated GTPase MeaB [Flavobacteriales bacterium]MDG1395020.1 methylmalonyl Co-A mutase-associated GTPase MeaB [Flavobacteriales bacterium]
MIKPKQSFSKKELSIQQYISGLRDGNVSILGRAITLVESTRISHQKKAQAILEECMPYIGKSVRIGITGVPGVGKSTFIERFGKLLTSLGKKVAVLAIDPSSEQGRGSILGDKTRMEELSRDPLAFIRPSPNAGSLGGVARKTRESILLCEAAGYEIIIVETVGVGQSETAVNSMVDFFLLLMLAGAGDELQGIKRGIMEMADAISITKADGDNFIKSRTAVGDYKHAIHLFPAKKNNWIPKVLTCSALENTGVQEIWNTIESFVNHCVTNGTFESARKKQAQYWLHESIQEQLGTYFYENPEVKVLLPELEKRVLEGNLSPFIGANQLIDLFKK